MRKKKINPNIPRDIFLIRYTKDEVHEWESLYEDLGSFRAVSRRLRKQNNGMGPSSPTIKRRLQAKFEKEGRDFDNWINKYNNFYSDDDVQHWKKMYEDFGSFRKVCKYWREGNNNFDLYPSTITYRLKMKSQKEGWDYCNWVKKYKRGYTKDDVQLWKLLYERLGSFRAVSRCYRQENHQKSPNASVIYYRLKKFFNRSDINFDEWVERFSQADEVWGKPQSKYDQDDLNYWEILYERYGSFNAVSKILRFQGKKSAATSTIILNLRSKFQMEGRNFTGWVNEYSAPYTDLASNIGRFVHNLLELILIEFSIKNNFKAFFEVNYFDNVIINPTGKINFLIIDYTISSDYGRIIEKCNRDYQGTEKKLIIVIFLSNKLITLPNHGIPHRDNIEIYNAQEFADNIGYKGKYLSDYEYIRYVARKAFYNNEAYKELRKMSIKAKNKLNKLAIQYSLQPEDFQNFVYSKSIEYLIK